MPVVSVDQWDAFISRQPYVHLLQTSAWGELKSKYGWQVERLISGEVGVQILFKRLPLGFSLGYIPKGPIGNLSEDLIFDLDHVCRARRTAFLRVEPDLWEVSDNEPTPPDGFQLGSRPVQPQRTIVVDLQGDENEILAQMKQKTRYNIRLAERKGIKVYSSDQLDLFHEMMKITGERDGFGVHSLDYYEEAYRLFSNSGNCELFFASFEEVAIAALMVFQYKGRSWYFYGASTDHYRKLMPTYLLQWRAMCWAKSKGCIVYDFWGVPDVDEEILEANFTQRSDGLWGVYRFKRGFGGSIQRAVGPWDRVYHPLLYSFYRFWSTRD